MSNPNVLQRVANINLLTDPNTNAVVGLLNPGNGKSLIVVVSSAAPSNNDGYPDGTIYIQTA
jgi:hypothetical protein